MYKETLTLIFEGESIQFTLKSEADEFIKRHNLQVEYAEENLIDNEHYEVKGYGAKIYWIAR